MAFSLKNTDETIQQMAMKVTDICLFLKVRKSDERQTKVPGGLGAN